jgi:hypothetical protein
MPDKAVVWMLCFELGIFVVGIVLPYLGSLFAGNTADRTVESRDRRGLTLTRLNA